MWSHNTNSLAFLIRFHVRFKIEMCSYTLAKKMSERFSVISNLAVSTRIAVDYCRLDLFFLREFIESKQVTKSASESKNNIELTEWYSFLNRTSQTCSQIK